jgi:hypothetical protein
LPSAGTTRYAADMADITITERGLKAIKSAPEDFNVAVAVGYEDGSVGIGGKNSGPLIILSHSLVEQVRMPKFTDFVPPTREKSKA